MASRVTSNFSNIRARMKLVSDVVINEVSQQLQKEADKIRDKAREYAPLEKGNLMNAIKSGQTNKTTWVVFIDAGMSDDTGKYKVGDYAFRLHEDTSWKPGPLTTSPRGPKFLERAYEELAKNFQRRMADATRRGLKRLD